jgi:acetyl esterase/lipase
VRYLRASAKKYNLDPNRFGAWGASAGGTLAALLGTTCNVGEFEGAELGYKEQSSCIQAAIDWFGPIDLLKINAQFEGRDCPGGHTDADSANSNESKWVGAPIQTVPDLVYKTNPSKFIDSGDSPFFIQHGSDDCTIPPEQSRDFADVLSIEIGKEKVFYSELQGATHGGDQFKTEANFELVGDFLNNFLK